MSVHGLLGTYTRFARGAHILHDCVRGRRSQGRGDLHIDNARQYTGTLVGWLRRFHGVATSYLPHYLLWHRQTHRLGPDQATAAVRAARVAIISAPKPLSAPRKPLPRGKSPRWKKPVRRKQRGRRAKESDND
jgi:hypothetical protein